MYGTSIYTADHQSAMDKIRTMAMKMYNKKENDFYHTTLEDMLKTIPLIDKNYLIQYNKLNSDKLLENSLLYSETSGTTGEPLQTPRNSTDLKWNTINQILAYKQILQPGSDRVAILHPSVLSPFVEASCAALAELNIGYVRLFPIPNICTYERMKAVIERYKITTIMSTPTLVYKLLYELRQMKDYHQNLSIKKILLTGEQISIENTKNMARLLNNEVIVLPFVYGSSETATLMYGTSDCKYIPILEDFIFEIIADDNVDSTRLKNNPIAAGRLIVTWLKQGMLPILRYDTKDLFAVYKNNINQYVFESLGRVDNARIDMYVRADIDKYVYSLPSPIYHYEYIVSDNKQYLLLITDKLDIDTHLRNTIKSLPLLKNCEVIINPKSHEFYNFSPTAKTNKFIWKSEPSNSHGY